MEMHQVRYFLAVARRLNFTRAAEDCHVSQPSLTRAIKNLEIELGGELFRRERSNSHLTELGQVMLPLLKNSYESALAAKSQAEKMKSGTMASLRIALTQSVDFDIVSDSLQEVGRSFGEINISCQRLSRDGVLKGLRNGDVDICIAGSLGESWERLDNWELFVESHAVAMSVEHPLAHKTELELADLAGERLITRPYCSMWADCASLLAEAGIDIDNCHEAGSDRDVIRLLEAGLGIAVVPTSTRMGDKSCKVPLSQVFKKSVHLYAVAGRQRSKALNGLINLLRSADWERFQGLGVPT
ncbi:DNA-binding transcriptional LysR family regulator [Labrenzia sp. MBR-25]